jgi:hypothetical protein
MSVSDPGSAPPGLESAPERPGSKIRGETGLWAQRKLGLSDGSDEERPPP